MENIRNKTVVIAGQARLPLELFGRETLQMVVELDFQDGKIVDLSVTPSLPVVDGFLRRQMIGLHLESQVEDLRNAIQQGMIYRGQKAILAALSDVVQQYESFLDSLPIPPSGETGGSRPN